MPLWRRPTKPPTPPPKPKPPPTPPSPPPKPKPTTKPDADVDTPNAPRSSGFSPAGIVGGVGGLGLALAPALLGVNPLNLAGNLADALGLDDLADGVLDFLGDITGINYLRENPLVAVGVVGGVSYVGLRFLRIL
jgi:hypothetical protein